ncbi:MAG: hypothetical protein E7576_01255 [Ruminococcaceae bacterium]|jgi:hypothetical protein|nr:hypothetical protein [Oscillospiraceae bacterium]
MNELTCGFADGLITPTLRGTFLDGYGFRTTPAESIRDDLHAKVMAVGDGESTALIFSLDLLALIPRLYKLVSRQITAITGVPAERIALNCIHTHSAPVAGGLAEMPIDTDYFAHVGDVCGEIALRAMERRVPGTFRAEILPERLIHVYNRRGRDVLDPSIRAAAFRDRSGKLRGVLCSASCHAVINTGMCVSADWLSVLNRSSSDDLPLLFLQGRAGDADPTGESGKDIDARIETLGGELASPVLRFAASEEAGEPVCGELRAVYEWIRVPMKPMRDTDALSAAVREAERDYFAAPEGKRHELLRELQWRRSMLDLAESGESGDLTVPMQLMTVGHALAFAFVPFELLTLTGDHIEAIFADAGWKSGQIYVCGYTNTVNGYLASREEFAYGGYEVSGASHWFGIPESVPETADTVIDWFRKNL